MYLSLKTRINFLYFHIKNSIFTIFHILIFKIQMLYPSDHKTIFIVSEIVYNVVSSGVLYETPPFRKQYLPV